MIADPRLREDDEKGCGDDEEGCGVTGGRARRSPTKSGMTRKDAGMTKKDAGMPPGQARGDRGSGRCGPAIEARRGGSGITDERTARSAYRRKTIFFPYFSSIVYSEAGGEAFFRLV